MGNQTGLHITRFEPQSFGGYWAEAVDKILGEAAVTRAVSPSTEKVGGQKREGEREAQEVPPPGTGRRHKRKHKRKLVLASGRTLRLQYALAN